MPPPPPTKRLKRFVRYLLLRAAAFLLGLLPARLASELGAGVGWLAFHLAWGERRKALESLARAFPERDEVSRRALARACFMHLGRVAAELTCIGELDRRLADWVDFPEEDHAALRRALARGNGVVFVAGHLGSWELLARTVALHGHPSTAIGKETSDPRTTRLVERFRARGGVGTIWRGSPTAARAMLRVLKRGEILGLLIDQDTKVQSVWVPFFGHLAKTPRAAGDLAVRTGAAVVFGGCRRLGDGRYRLTIEEVPIPAGPDDEARSVALTARLTARIEAAIREAPEQWVWMHRRWRSPPPPPEAAPQPGPSSS